MARADTNVVRGIRIGDDGEYVTEVLGWELANRDELREAARWWRAEGHKLVEPLPFGDAIKQLGGGDG